LYVAGDVGVQKTVTPAHRTDQSDRDPIPGKVHLVDIPPEEDRRYPVPSDRTLTFGFAPGEVASDHMTVLAVGFSNGNAVAYGIAFDLAIVPDEVRLATCKCGAPRMATTRAPSRRSAAPRRCSC
jgi:hypothetical protein